MKICHVTSVHNTNDIRIFRKECITLAEQDDYNVCIVGQGKNEVSDRVKIVGVGEKPYSRLNRMFMFAPKVFNAALELDADIYHLHDPELLRFALKMKKSGKKVIFDSHENILDSIDEKEYMPLLLRKIMKLYYRWLQNKVLKKLDAIIVVTPQMVDTHKKYNDNVMLVPNFPRIGDENYLKAKSVKGRFMFAGGVGEEWSHKEIITALKDIENVEYYIFGPGEDKYIKELEQLSGWNKVHYGGLIPFHDVQEELSKTQFVFALCKPNKNTFYKQGTLGNTKLFEAMEKGKPVIATDFELWKDIVEEADCGICVDPNNIDEIRDAIIKIMKKTDKEISQMGINGRNIVKEKYSWENVEKTLLDIYKQLSN